MNHTFSKEHDGVEMVWDVHRLWHESKSLYVTSVMLTPEFVAKNLSWADTKPLSDEDEERIAEADLSYPIILNSEGEVMDGQHRILKALREGHDRVLAVQFQQDPVPDLMIRVKPRVKKFRNAALLKGR